MEDYIVLLKDTNDVQTKEKSVRKWE
jgi:hypothetical protein